MTTSVFHPIAEAIFTAETTLMSQFLVPRFTLAHMWATATRGVWGERRCESCNTWENNPAGRSSCLGRPRRWLGGSW